MYKYFDQIHLVNNFKWNSGYESDFSVRLLAHQTLISLVLWQQKSDVALCPSFLSALCSGSVCTLDGSNRCTCSLMNYFSTHVMKWGTKFMNDHKKSKARWSPVFKSKFWVFLSFTVTYVSYFHTCNCEHVLTLNWSVIMWCTHEEVTGTESDQMHDSPNKRLSVELLRETRGPSGWWDVWTHCGHLPVMTATCDRGSSAVCHFLSSLC